MRPPVLLLGLAAVLLLGGAALFIRTFWRLCASIRAKHTLGAPYRDGMIADRFLGWLMTWPLPLLGALAAFLALAQAAFQPTHPVDPVRVGRVEAKKAGWAQTAVLLEPDASYPETRPLDGTIPGARWAFEGDFVVWNPGVRWLGLVDGHRIRALLGTGDPSGTSPFSAKRVRIDAPPRATEVLLRYARFVPFLKVRQGTSPWFPQADRRILLLYVTPEGYVADSASETTSR